MAWFEAYDTFGTKILDAMRAAIGNQINVRDIIMGNAYFAPATETRLASIANQFADTAIAQQQIATDQALAKANLALEKSLTPAVVEYTCLTTTQDIYKSGGAMNAGWSCSGSEPLAISSGSTK